MFLAATLAWPRVPVRVPVHWGINGEVDRYGGRFEGVWLVPLLALGSYLLLRFLPQLDPGRANYAHFSGPYRLLRLATLLVLAGLYVTTLLAAVGREADMARVVPLLVGGHLLVLGSIMGKLRPTWFVGIRTPWSLSSARSWGKTNRLGGRIFIGIGLLMVGGGLLDLPTVAFGGIVAIVVATAGLVVYSYVVWREDQGAVPPTGRWPAEED